MTRKQRLLAEGRVFDTVTVHHQPTETRPQFTFLLLFAWTMIATVLGTVVLSLLGVFSPFVILGTIVVCGPVAFLSMLLADKV